MSETLSPVDAAKYAAALRAADYVEDGMKVGFGTGSTAEWFTRIMGQRQRDDGITVTCVPTSRRTAEQARAEGINVVTLDEARWLDITVDGADEFDGELNLIKGGGGALLHEKVVATASDRMVVIADTTKKVETLGAFPLPVEVLEFGFSTTRALIEEMVTGLDVMGSTVRQRIGKEGPFRTDEGNLILDLHLERIGNARQLALILNQIPGVVENGLFIDICDVVVVGHGDGRVDVRDINTGEEEEWRIELPDVENVFRN